MKILQESGKGGRLLGRSRVLGSLAVFSTSSDIYSADAKAVVSVLLAMGAHQIERSTIMDGAVEINHFVITDLRPMVLAAMDVVNLLDGHWLALGCGGAMDYDFVDASHSPTPSSFESMTDLSSANLV